MIAPDHVTSELVRFADVVIIVTAIADEIIITVVNIDGVGEGPRC